MNKFRELFKSKQFWGAVCSIAAMALIAMIYFYPDAMQGNVLRQHDMQQGTAIGQEAKAYAEATGISPRWTGSLFSGMPTFQISPTYPSNSLFSWLNTVMGLGLPSPANLLFMMMVGFFILLMAMRMRWYVALIGAVSYGLSSYFIIIIGAGHLWKFITLAYVPPTIAGVMLCYRGRYLRGAALAALFAMLQIAANHVQMSYYFLFVIAGVAIAFLIKAIRTRTVRTWLIGTASLAGAAVLAVGANLPSLYNTYEYSKQTMRGGHSELTRADSSDAAEASSGLDRDYITQYSYTPSESFSLLIPDIKGGASNKPEKGENKITSLSELDAAKDMVSSGALSAEEASYLSYMSQYFGDPEGTNGPVYVGALVLALFFLGCAIVKGPLKWALVILTVLSILLALGRHFMALTDLMIDYMPMYSKFRTVESILVIAEFTIPLLAAMALQQIFSTKASDAWERYHSPFLWSFGITLGLCLIGILAPGLYGDTVVERDRQIAAMISQSIAAQGADAETIRFFSLDNPRIYAAVESLRSAMVRSDAMRSFIIVAAGFGVLLLYFRRKLSAAVAVALAGVIVLADLFTVNKRYLDTESFLPRRLAQGEPFPFTDADRAILTDTASSYRVMNIPEFWSAAPSYRHKTIGGYHAAKLARYQDIIDRHLTHFLDGTQTDADWNVLNMLNARYIVDMNGQPLVNPEAMGNAWMIDNVQYVTGADAEMEALSRINPANTAVASAEFKDILGTSATHTAGDTIRLTSYAPDHLTYHAQTARGGVAVFSEVYFPWGWKATIDGKPVDIARVNYILRAINLPAGSHSVEMWFDPDSLRNTSAIATVSVILIYILCGGAIAIWAIRRRKEPAADVATPNKK
ncbi:MAG: YfhO family protein [Muribaculaceae bacterium]|nr:YfhO family protein [Muribaculaceae bacterium]